MHAWCDVNIAVKPVTVNFLTGVTMKAQLIVPGSAMRKQRCLSGHAMQRTQTSKELGEFNAMP